MFILGRSHKHEIYWYQQDIQFLCFIWTHIFSSGCSKFEISENSLEIRVLTFLTGFCFIPQNMISLEKSYKHEIQIYWQDLQYSCLVVTQIPSSGCSKFKISANSC